MFKIPRKVREFRSFDLPSTPLRTIMIDTADLGAVTLSSTDIAWRVVQNVAVPGLVIVLLRPVPLKAVFAILLVRARLVVMHRFTLACL